MFDKKKIKQFKPGVNRAVHLFAAPLLWTGVGCMLMIRGLGWIGPGNELLCIVLAFIAGTAKSIFILDKTAKRGVERIVRLQDGTCLGAVYSWKTWVLVLIMIVSGNLLRVFFEPGNVIGTIYVAVGWALILSSRHGWFEWSRWINRQRKEG